MVRMLGGVAGRAAAMALVAGLAAGTRAGVEVRGSVAEVTVYRGQAMVTRHFDVPAPAEGGLVELVVSDLPERIAPASLFAEGRGDGAGVEVRSVRYRVRPVLQDVNERVRALDEQIRGLEDRIRGLQKRTELLGQHRAYLDKLEQFIAPAATVELSRGVLNAETLKALTELLRTQRMQLAEEELRLAVELRDLGEQKTLAERERAQITQGSARTLREAVILVNVRPGARGPALAVRYLVDQAGWTPSYTIRADGARDAVRVEYYAAIQQMSGEDWSDVAMTLSTATPSLIARAPTLEPMTVSLVSGAPVQQVEAAYMEQKGQIARQRREAEQLRNMVMAIETGGRRDGPAPDTVLNTLANDEQLLDLLVRQQVARSTRRPPAREENLSVTYDLPARTSLPSRADRQQVQIAAISLPSEFYKVATPVLTEFVYDEAMATNTSPMVLLAGPAATYVEGRFVGSGEVPTVTTGEKFIVGLGIDSSLRASRELVERLESVQGGNRVVDLVYRLTVENFGGAPATVRLLDRLPKARESEVRLTLTDPGHPLASDAADVQNQKKNGILRWDVTVPAGASGGKAFSLEYRFRLEHDKQMILAGGGT